jgi:short-subunit dehydrogenase
MNVKGKIAVVTGASSGIGLAVAKLLTQKGAKVALAARSKEKLEKIAKELPGSIVIQADMTKKEEIEGMIKKAKNHFGRIDLLINNAGQGYDASIEETDIDIFHRLFDLDVVGPLIAIQEVVPIMKKQGGGVIVNISSGTALMALPNMSAYSSLKRALAGISLTANEEFKQDKILVSVVYPYITLTDFEKNTIKAKNMQEVQWEEEEESDFKPPDSAGYVAEKILEGIENEKREVYVHGWMEKMTSAS